MKPLIVIPSRYGSTRFPGKPLAEIRGKSLLKRVWEIASASGVSADVVIATDDKRIFAHAEQFGAHVIMTRETCKNGSERTFEVLKNISFKPNIIVNLQGDAVLTPPKMVATLIEEMKKAGDSALGTIAVPLSSADVSRAQSTLSAGKTAGTFVTFDNNGEALYFSRSLIPHIRTSGKASVYKHVGIYGFSPKSLSDYVSLPPTPLEETEGLEQLRALEHGMKIKVTTFDLKGRTMWSVDLPEDIKRVEEIIDREGEPV